MGGKRNKIRYQSRPKEKILLPLTGDIYLMHRDDDAIAQAKRGDLLVYPSNEALHTTRQGDYHSTGFSGYFKVEVSDGKEWRLVLTNGIFAARENHFTKSECPIDTYNLCAGILRGLAGKCLQRTYREHYELLNGE